ncbi:hypothetical protein OHA25_60475 (plasmid) [Nonomuraea sp. NBC_00507]|uniref:hypothetical protein n=1 Tax=Nonomuraea sp. NBC_00507 TaxID=2976002 RepID=UPI002E174CCB
MTVTDSAAFPGAPARLLRELGVVRAELARVKRPARSCWLAVSCPAMPDEERRLLHVRLEPGRRDRRRPAVAERRTRESDADLLRGERAATSDQLVEAVDGWLHTRPQPQATYPPNRPRPAKILYRSVENQSDGFAAELAAYAQPGGTERR